MGDKISWTFKAVVDEGPQISASQSIAIGAFDSVEGVVPAKQGNNAGTVTLDVQPTAAVKFITITADTYDADLKFTVMNGGVADVALEGPLVLSGAGIDTLLQGPPKKIKFTNDLATEVSVEIVVGR